MESSASRFSLATSAFAVAGDFTPEDEVRLREALKRCSPSTFEAACQFRKTGNLEHLPVIVFGIVEHFVESKYRPKLKESTGDLRLAEDLGVDSLTMIEIVMLTEDTLRITINNEDLCTLRTVGDVRHFLEGKLTGVHFDDGARRLAS
jgi:3-hydroxyacyl-[acyl-carrier-protein] dehydratase